MSDYVTRILATLGDRDPLTSLHESCDAIELTARTIFKKNLLDRVYAPGKWSARQVICHLADAEVGIGFRMRQVITVDNIVVQPFDEQKWAERYESADAMVALQSFVALRDWNLTLLDSFPRTAWSKPYRHPEQGDLRFETMIKLFAGHDINHLNQLKAIEAGTTL